MSTTPDREAIVARIQKILALAGNNPSEAERQVAMAKAHQMLAEHNLSLEEVEKSTADPGVVHIIVKGRSGPWVKTVYKNVGLLYFCDYVFMNFGKETSHFFIGRESDVRVAHAIASWVSEAMWREGLRGKRETGSDNSYLTSFLNVGSLRISERVREMIQRAREGNLQGSTGTALVLASLYDQAVARNDTYTAETLAPRETKTRMSASNYHGSRDGRAFADKVNLGPQVEAGRRGPALPGR